MKIAIASDHGGVNLKKVLKEKLINDGYEVLDFSEKNTPTDDYPDFAYLVGKSIQDKKADRGILVCTRGIGISIAANKMKGIYCGKVASVDDVTYARWDNGVNVIAIGGATENLAKEIVDKFLSEPALIDERHERRFNKIIKIENGTYNEL